MHGAVSGMQMALLPLVRDMAGTPSCFGVSGCARAGVRWVVIFGLLMFQLGCPDPSVEASPRPHAHDIVGYKRLWARYSGAGTAKSPHGYNDPVSPP